MCELLLTCKIPFHQNILIVGDKFVVGSGNRRQHSLQNRLDGHFHYLQKLENMLQIIIIETNWVVGISDIQIKPIRNDSFLIYVFIYFYFLVMNYRWDQDKNLILVFSGVSGVFSTQRITFFCQQSIAHFTSHHFIFLCWSSKFTISLFAITKLNLQILITKVILQLSVLSVATILAMLPNVR